MAGQVSALHHKFGGVCIECQMGFSQAGLYQLKAWDKNAQQPIADGVWLFNRIDRLFLARDKIAVQQDSKG